MKEVGPVYKKALLVAVVIYIAGVCYLQTDLYAKVGFLEHISAHSAAGAGGACH
jgi:hypothetical protein